MSKSIITVCKVASHTRTHTTHTLMAQSVLPSQVCGKTKTRALCSRLLLLLNGRTCVVRPRFIERQQQLINPRMEMSAVKRAIDSCSSLLESAR